MAQEQRWRTQERRWVGVAEQKGKSGRFRIYFYENDVRRACRMMLCGDNCENCISLMKKGRMTCELCHAVLKALRRRPEQVRVSGGSSFGDSAAGGSSSFMEAAKSRVTAREEKANGSSESTH